MLRTKRQKKNLCRSCPVAKTADLLGDSITLLIIRDLLEKPRRFGDFELALQGVSTRTLSNRLKTLETCGLIERDDSLRTLPRIDYRITRKGAALRPLIEAMRTYGEKYL